MAEKKKLSASLEDYLEAIYNIVAEKGAARPTDIATYLNVANSSTTGAMRLLKEHNLINYKPYGLITLTAKGKKTAINIANKHKILTRFFTKILAIDEETSNECACQMEHSIPDKVLKRFIEFIDFKENSPHPTAEWVEGIGFTCKMAKSKH